MALDEVLAKVPAELQSEIKAAVQAEIVAGDKLAGVDSKEKAAEWMEKNELFRSALDAERSRVTAKYREKFEKDDLPKLIDAEIKKRNPDKDPVRAELEELKAQMAKREEDIKREKLHAYATKLAADEGIPVDEIARFIDTDEDATARSVKAYAKKLKDWRDEAVTKKGQELVGNKGAPQGGQAPGDLAAMYSAAQAKGDVDAMLLIKDQMRNALK